MASSDPRLVVFKGGVTASLEVVERLLAIEARSARFVLLADGRFQVDLVDVLTD